MFTATSFSRIPSRADLRQTREICVVGCRFSGVRLAGVHWHSRRSAHEHATIIISDRSNEASCEARTNKTKNKKGYNKAGSQREYIGRIGARIRREIVLSVLVLGAHEAQASTHEDCGWRGIFWCGQYGRLDSQGEERRATEPQSTDSIPFHSW